MRKLALVLGMFLWLTISVSAQEFNVGFGVSGVKGPDTNSASGNHSPVQVGGGTFLNVSGEYLFRGNFGIGSEIAWRAGRNSYLDIVEFRPIFYDFNAVYAPKLGDRASLDLMAGIGAQSTRFYTGNFNCNQFTGSCTDYQSSNHFMGHFGAGLRLYPTQRFFVRPEAHLYAIRNNEEFSGPWATRFGVTLGYSFGRQ